MHAGGWENTREAWELHRNLILIEREIFYVVQKIEAVFTESPVQFQTT